jgi:hypothetical protein
MALHTPGKIIIYKLLHEKPASFVSFYDLEAHFQLVEDQSKGF